MRNVAILLTLITLVLTACMPEEDITPKLHDIALYGTNPATDNILYGYFYGGPITLTIGDQDYELTNGMSDDALAVGSASLVNDQPYIKQALAPIEPPTIVERIPLTTTLKLTVNRPIQELLYYDGQRWLTLSGPQEKSFTGTVIPRERIGGLRGFGELSREEADMLSEQLESRGPLTVALLASDVAPRRRVEGLAEYLRTVLYVQQGLATDTSLYTPPAQTLNWEMFAQGDQAIAEQAPEFYLVKSQEQLVSLWNKAYGSRLTVPSLPDVDFRRETILVAFMGQQSSGGYGLDVLDVSVDGRDVYVDLEQITPAAGTLTTQALTSPWLMLRVFRSDLDVAWFREPETDSLIGVARATQ